MKELSTSQIAQELTPVQVVKELDKYIVGQEEAKKCVAIAIRNRWRRQQLSPHLRDEVSPKNILMIGPTGVGKTEIARRLASLVKAPFLKVEATKYTEIGYHGRDVESIIRDLAELSVSMVKQEYAKCIEEKATKIVEDKLIHLIQVALSKQKTKEEKSNQQKKNSKKIERAEILQKFKNRELENQIVEIMVEERNLPMVEIFSSAGFESIGLEFQNMFEKLTPMRGQVKKMTVAEAREVLMQQELDKLIDREKVSREGLKRAENMGVIFIDEIDKIVGSEYRSGPDVSREGVQRDLLPFVEGCSVMTRYGMMRTDHILFIAAGAFSKSKPSDLLPELQGRFPIRVELKALTKEDFVRILQEPQNALTKQYQALLKTEGIDLVFSKDAIEKIATICAEVNQKTQNIGARRLHTIMEKLIEDISFQAPEMSGQTITINGAMVSEKLSDISKNEDLSRYIL